MNSDMNRKDKTEKFALNVLGTVVIVIIVLAVWIQFFRVM